MGTARLFRFLLVPGLAATAAQATVEVERAGGQSRFTIEDSSVSDLSGITWIAGDEFAAVSDKRRIVQRATLRIDRATGAITGGKLGNVEEVTASAGDFGASAAAGAAAGAAGAGAATGAAA